MLGDGVFDFAREARLAGFFAGVFAGVFVAVAVDGVAFKFFFAEAFLLELVDSSPDLAAAAALLEAFLGELAFLAGAFLVEAVVDLVAMGNVVKSFHHNH